jgi:hypothetical protein
MWTRWRPHLRHEHLCPTALCQPQRADLRRPISPATALLEQRPLGQGKISGVAGWLHGERLDTSTGLYQMMPLNLRVAFDEELKGFTPASASRPWIASPTSIRIAMNKPRRGTRSSICTRATGAGTLHANAAADNLLNKWYELPIGRSELRRLHGQYVDEPDQAAHGHAGRSVSFSLTARF